MTDPHRFVPNRFADYSPSAGESSAVTAAALEDVLRIATDVLEEALPPLRGHMTPDVYLGLAGVAMFYLHLAENSDILFITGTTHKAKNTSKEHWLSRARACLNDAHTRCRSETERTGASFLRTSMGVWAVECALSSIEKGTKYHVDIGKAIENIENEGYMLSTNDRWIQTTPDEVITGRAGYLFAAMYADLYAKSVGKQVNAGLAIHPVVMIIHESGKQGHRRGISDAHVVGLKEPPLSYVWRDDPYIGAAHGLASILYVLLDGIRAGYIVSVNGLLGDITHSLDYLQTLRMPSGNYCTQVENPAEARDRFCQWCHGAPGMAMLYVLAYEVLQDEKYLQWAKEACDFTWRYGLLRKDPPSLCHGAAGNGYSFLALYDVTHDQKYLHRAVQFAKHTAEWVKKMAKDKAYDLGSRGEKLSLYDGLTGAAYYIADVIIYVRSHVHEIPVRLGMPGFALPRV